MIVEAFRILAAIILGIVIGVRATESRERRRGVRP